MKSRVLHHGTFVAAIASIALQAAAVEFAGAAAETPRVSAPSNSGTTSTDVPPTGQLPSTAAREEKDGFDIIPGENVYFSSEVPIAKAYRAIRSAQLHLKFGVAERGNLAAFGRAEEDLDHAASLLVAATADGSGTASEREKASEVIEGLRRESAALTQTASGTLFGRFPLIRGFDLKDGADDVFLVHSYFLPGAARRHAVRGALKQIAQSAASDPLHVIVMLPNGLAGDLKAGSFAALVEAEVQHAFATTPNAKLYPGLLRAQLDPMPAWNAPDPAFNRVCRQFCDRENPKKDPHTLMIVMVREFMDDGGDSYCVQAQQRTFSPANLAKAEEQAEKLEADKVRVSECLTHDRSQLRGVLVIGDLLLLALGLATHYWLSHQSWRRWRKELALPVCGYILGLALVPVLGLATQQWLPKADSHAAESLWWPCLAGAATLLLPAGAFRLIGSGVNRYFTNLSCHGRWGITFVPIAFGVCAGWLRPACAVLGTDCWPLMIAMVVAAVTLLYCFGRAIDVADHFPTSLTPFIAGVALLFGAGAFLGSPLLLWTTAAVAGAISFNYMRRHRSATEKQEFDDVMQPQIALGTRRPRTLVALRKAVVDPPYQPPAEFQLLRQMIAEPSFPESNWIGIIGPPGAGKTPAARQLLHEIEQSHDSITVLSGKCVEETLPYGVFREALATVGILSSLLTSQAANGNINSVFDRLANQFIPFWDFLASSSEAEADTTRKQLLAAITTALQELASKKPVVLFLDDCQWLDEGSVAVIKHLRSAFSTGEKPAIAIVMASHDGKIFDALDLNDYAVSLNPPQRKEQIQILEKSLGIVNVAARHLVDSLGVMGSEPEAMFWLMRAVRELADADGFIETPHGFTLHTRYFEQGALPVPSELRKKLLDALRASGQNQLVLECAALLGEKFRVDDLATCLRMDQLDLLQILRRLEHDLQVVRDIPTDPHRYAFSSTYLFQIVLEELGEAPRNAAAHSKRSKVARELHARIAAVLEDQTPRTPHLICAIAHHYHSAGEPCARKAMESCLVAAHAACKWHGFRRARRFLAMAEEAARLSNQSFDVARERALIDEAETAVLAAGFTDQNEPVGNPEVSSSSVIA